MVKGEGHVLCSIRSWGCNRPGSGLSRCHRDEAEESEEGEGEERGDGHARHFCSGFVCLEREKRMMYG